MNTCKDKVALIVGGAGSIGRSTALTLAREGAKIVINYRKSKEQADALVQHIQSVGGEAITIQADATRQEDVQRLVVEAEAVYGQIEILVNCAGGEWNIRDYTEMEPDQWRAVLTGEIDSTLLLLKYIVPGMRQRQWGRIIHLGMDHVSHLKSVKNVAPDYCLGKAARSWITTAMGLDEFGHGITVNCIAPGYTPPLDSLEEASQYALHSDGWENRQHLSPQDIAEGIAFLCSEAGRFLTSSELTYIG